MARPQQLRLLRINQGEDRTHTLYRLEKGWVLHFVLGPSLAGLGVRLFINHPLDPRKGPNRHVYHELQWQNYSGSKVDVYDNYAEVHICLAGSFNYYFTLDGSDDQETANGRGYFIVDPVLLTGQYDTKLPLDAVACQTVLTKLLGPFPQWEDRLRVAKESGYNMIHFTPLQELGASQSSYCLSDQLKLNPDFSTMLKSYTFEDVGELVKKMRDEWEVLSLTDLVLNHTANESKWLQEHPESAYNVVNTPHLRPAYLIDRIFWHFTLDVAEGVYEDIGISAEINDESQLAGIRELLTSKIIPSYNIHEFYQMNVDAILQEFVTLIKDPLPDVPIQSIELPQLEVIQDPAYRRMCSTIDYNEALKLYRKDGNLMNLTNNLNDLNQKQREMVEGHLAVAADNLIANIRWRFVDPNGLRLGTVSRKTPLMWHYFVLPNEGMTMVEEEARMEPGAGGDFCMAHNGWVINANPMENFAEPGSNVYLRRELIPWGDSVKLKFGKSKEDNPYLWEHMRKYTVETATVFHGVRLDNCHSTPIHVAEYLLDEARMVRPDLYVIAELFTNNPSIDNIFINRLGLNSLIREAMNAWEPYELGRLVHAYGGRPVGSLLQPPCRLLMPSKTHAIFLDQTHDNESPVEKWTALNLLPTSALVAMTCSASGSNRGYDELVPHHINVVTETRLYTSWSEASKNDGDKITKQTGLIEGKKILNKLHSELANAGFNQVYVDKLHGDIVVVTRHNPVNHQGVIMVVRMAFHEHCDNGDTVSMSFPGIIEEVLLEAHTVQRTGATTYTRDPRYLNGLPNYTLKMRENFKIDESKMVRLKESSTSEMSDVEFHTFVPGSIVCFKIILDGRQKSAILNVRQLLSQFGYRMRTYSGRTLQEIMSTDLERITANLSLNDLNRVLFRVSGEEYDDGLGFGAYNLPGFGDLNYCGLQGLVSVLRNIRKSNDLGHPLCCNLRDGDWLLDYIANRLKVHSGTKQLGIWFETAFSNLRRAPRYLIPCYFDAIIFGVYSIVEEVAWATMSDFVQQGSSFERSLAMGSLQFVSYVRTASLPQMSPNLAPPRPTTELSPEGVPQEITLSLSAGLPHFSCGIWRNWGRDTFISFRGLLLITGRYEDARYLILAYAATLRHGLIPNLLGGGVNPRYNCRDAVWWWLQCIQEYCMMVDDGHNILKDNVSRIFPSDNSRPHPPGDVDQPLASVVQEALQKHAEGLKFRERDAGPGIDNDMSDAGFIVQIGVNWKTGFVRGGNAQNCGTWMDKMGSSHIAGNKGIPATPRDGSAVELVGLCKSTVRWLHLMYEQGKYPFRGVEKVEDDGKRVGVSYAEWDRLIQNNFEKYFWINATPDPKETAPNLINKRGIYKDTVGASHMYTEYQLRPNFPIALVVAPELVEPEHAWIALGQAQKHLLGPLGMKTLDPSDMQYRGSYYNSDDTNGFNYHNGPEWVWPVGYFLRAKLRFAALDRSNPARLSETVLLVKRVLARHNVQIHFSEWKSLPELTNENGMYCPDSCGAQAWSMGCMLEVLYMLENLSTLSNRRSF